MSKKKRKKRKPKSKIDLLEIYKKIRKVWTINPKTRVKPKKKKYNRSAEKRRIKKELDNG